MFGNAWRNGGRVLFVTAFFWACSDGGVPIGSGNPASSRADALAAHLELAKEGGFALVIDEAEPAASLFLGGVPLHHYTVLAVERPIRRAFFLPLPSPPDPSARVWRGGIQDPERVRDRKELEYREAAAEDAADDEVPAEDADAAPAPEAPKIPPTPEEAVPAPDAWCLRFADGPEVWFLGVGPEGQGMVPPELEVGRIDVLRDALKGRQVPSRMRILMPLDEAQALFRSLPPDIAVLVVPAR